MIMNDKMKMDIISMGKGGEKAVEISKRLEVPLKEVNDVISKYVKKKRLTPEEIEKRNADIILAHQNGKSQREISFDMGLAVSTISHILVKNGHNVRESGYTLINPYKTIARDKLIKTMREDK
jgi:hypothetical protein